MKKNPTYYFLNVLILIPLFFLNSCSINRIIVNSAVNFIEDGIIVVYREGDLTLAEQFLGNNLKTIEVLLEKDPKNKKLNLLASEGFGAYAMGFVEDIDPERAGNLYKRGLHYALKALPADKKFDESITPQELEELLKKYKKNDIGSLFWTGYNWGCFTLLNLSDVRNLINLSKIELIMRRCMELDENYNFAGVDLFYGAYYAGRPKMLGGDFEKGKEYYIRNIELNKNRVYLAHYFYARYYAVQTLNEELFDNLLDEILTLNLDKYPDVRLLNAIAKQKAKLLVEKKDRYF